MLFPASDEAALVTGTHVVTDSDLWAEHEDPWNPPESKERVAANARTVPSR